MGYEGKTKFATAVLLLGLTWLTVAANAAAALPDNRGWELVSPVDKNGGGIAAPGALAGGGLLQAAADGSAVTYGSASSFGSAAQGAPPASQYLSLRTAGGWLTENITEPLLSGSYGTEPNGVPYRLFSEDLGRGLLLNGQHCRGEAESGCAVANPPLAGTDAPAGYQNYYLRQSAGGGLEALMGSGDVAQTDLEPADFELRLAGASPDLDQVALSTCAALTADATEAPSGDGCDPAQPNLYLWSAGGLRLVNSSPGAALAAETTAVSPDGSRVYWTDLGSGDLYLRQGAATRQVDLAAGGGGTFEIALAEGAIAFFTKEGHLWSYDASSDSATDLTPAGGVLGVLGASADGAYVYYLTAAGLFVRHGGSTTEVASGADVSNYPPTKGTARVSADGHRLAFVSRDPLTGYDNTDQKTGLPDSEVFVYDAVADLLRCASCRPNGARPIGDSTIPGALANGEVAWAQHSYKPRALSADGRHLFFDSRDVLVPTDTNNDRDVYQWEALGAGSCAKAAGCVGLISSGRAEGGAIFVDASASGGDAFFLTDGSLVGTDPGAVDLYDARIGGGFPEPLMPIPCTGDSCQSLPPEPTDPTLSTLAAGPGNPRVRYVKHRRKAQKCRRASKRGARSGKRRKCGRHKSGTRRTHR